MPWDGPTRLVVSRGRGEATVVAGGDRRVDRPADWAPDGSLWFFGDRSGWWNLYRWTPTGRREDAGRPRRRHRFPQWVFGQSCFALPRRTAVSPSSTGSDGGLDRSRWPSRDGWSSSRRRSAVHCSIGAARRGFALASPPGRRPSRTSSRSTSTPAAVEVLVAAPRPRPRPGDGSPRPSRSRSRPPAAAPPTRCSTGRPTPRSPRPDERPPLLVLIHGGSHLGGPADAPAVTPVLDEPRLRGRRRQLPRLHRLRPRLPRPAARASGAWPTWRTASPCAEHLVERGDVDPDRLCIRGGSAGGFTTLAALTFHEVFAAGASHYGVADLGVLAAETHKFESRYLDGLVGPWPEEARLRGRAVADLPHRSHRPPACVFQGLDDQVVPPNQAEMIVDALRPRACRWPTSPSRASSTASASQNIRAALEAELSFYAQVLGFDLGRRHPPPVEPDRTEAG